MPMIKIPRRLPSEAGGQERRIIGPTGIEDQAIGAFGDSVIRAAGAAAEVFHEEQREEDILTAIREEAQFETTIVAGRAAKAARMKEYALSDGYTEEGAVELDRQLTEELYASATDGITSDRLRARAEGLLAGEMSSDLTEDLAVYRLARGAQGIQRAVEWAGEMIGNPNISLDMFPGLVASVGGKLDRAAESNPELANDAVVARKRVWDMVRNAHVAAGARQEINLWSSVAQGGYSELGEEVISADRADALRRIDDLVEEVAEEERFGADYGPVIDNGGRFPTFQRGDADASDLDDLEDDLAWLPEGRRAMLQAEVGAMKLARERRGMIMSDSIGPHFETGEPIPGGIGTGTEAFFAYEAYAGRFVIPWLNERPGPDDDPRAHLLDRVAFLSREVNSVGFLSPTFATWVEETVALPTSNPDTVAAIALGTRANGYNGVLAQKARTSVPELELEMQGMTPRLFQELSDDTNQILDGMVRLSGIDSALALQTVRDSMALGRDQRTKAAADAGAGELERLFAPDELSEADQEAAEIAGEVTEGLRESFERAGHEVTAISAEVEDQVRLLTRGFFQRNLLSGMPKDAALESAADLAVAAVLKATPPLTIGNRTYMSKAIDDLLERDANGIPKYPPEMIQFEKQLALDKLQLGELDDRTIIVQPPGQGLLPHQFMLMVEGTDDEPWRLLDVVVDMRGEASAYRAVEEESRLAGMEQAASAALAKGTSPEAVRKDFAESFFYSREEWNRWASQASNDAVLFPRSALATGYGTRDGKARILAPGPGDSPLDIAMKERATGRTSVSKLFDSLKDGEPLFMAYPKLRREYERAYKTELNDRVREWDEKAGRSGSFLAKKMPPNMVQYAELRAAQKAKRAVRLLLEKEFNTPSAAPKAQRTGKLPSEEK